MIAWFFGASKLASIARYVAAIAAVLALCVGMVVAHDRRLENEWTARQQAAVSAALAEQAQRNAAVVAEAVASERARAAATVRFREVIRNVPVSTGCVTSAAVGAALDGLYPNPGAGAADNRPAAGVLPAGAAAPGATGRH